MLVSKVIVAALAVAVFAAPAQAQGRELLMPGVTYERQVVFSSHGPVAVHVLTAHKPGGLWSLEPALSNSAIVGRQTVTALSREAGRGATVAAVNGDFFAGGGAPEGIVVRGGVLEHEPRSDRASVGVAPDGTLRVDRVRVFGRWWGTGQRRPLDLNRPPAANGAALFTPSWGTSTPAGQGVVEAVISGLPPIRAGVELAGSVARIGQTNGGTPIPRDGAVLVGRGAGAGFVSSEAPSGATLNVRLLLSPDWSDVSSALGGGPALVRDGRPVFRHAEAFGETLLGRAPRSAVGQLRDGRVVLVAVDGGQRGYSVGMTSFELAQTLVRLSAVTGSGLGTGPAATMAFEGRLLNRPPGGRETPVADALLVAYRGVYAAPPSEPVLSPNADGVAETESLAYKLPRAAMVTAELVGPGRLTRTLESRAREAGTHRFSWGGRAAGGAVEPEGAWQFRVTAAEPGGQTTTAQRDFSLNRTLGSLAVRPGARRSVRASFALAHAAKVTGFIETRAGAVVAVTRTRTLNAGRRAVVWNGRASGRPAHRGGYVFRVAAVNKLGRAELAQRFALG